MVELACCVFVFTFPYGAVGITTMAQLRAETITIVSWRPDRVCVYGGDYKPDAVVCPRSSPLMSFRTIGTTQTCSSRSGSFLLECRRGWRQTKGGTARRASALTALFAFAQSLWFPPTDVVRGQQLRCVDGPCVDVEAAAGVSCAGLAVLSRARPAGPPNGACEPRERA